MRQKDERRKLKGGKKGVSRIFSSLGVLLNRTKKGGGEKEARGGERRGSNQSSINFASNVRRGHEETKKRRRQPFTLVSQMDLPSSPPLSFLPIELQRGSEKGGDSWEGGSPSYAPTSTLIRKPEKRKKLEKGIFAFSMLWKGS